MVRPSLLRSFALVTLTGSLMGAAPAAETLETIAEAPLSRSSFRAGSWEAQRAAETRLMGAVDKESIRWFHERLADEPNRAGTVRNRKTAEWMVSQFARFGLDASLEEFDVLLTEPIDAEVEIVAPERVTLPIRERVLSEDPHSAVAENEFGWNAFSGSGEAQGRVVYANYGRKEDFARLRELGVDVRGAIVLARYGGNFRGFKAKFAKEAGAAGLIIYTDPADSGRGDGYPDGVWANGSTIQRGSIITNEHRGDPLTPGWPSVRGQKRLDEADAGLPTIPVQPIGWDAAKEILSRMRGESVPEGWKGGLDLAYRLTGGEDLRVRVKVAQSRARTTIANPIGVLRGSEEPDRAVVIGCHFDAWVYGAWDPASGMSVVMELARIFGEAAQNGWTPKRTIMFIGWDAEEYGLMGSTEWGEHHAANLKRNAIAYYNLDAAVSGERFGASAWPSLKTLIAESTAVVPSIANGDLDDPSVLEEWVRQQGGADLAPSMGEMGGGSDHSVFLFHLGVPSAGAGVRGVPPANYHSVYDSLHWYQTHVLPDYEPAAKLTKVVAVNAARLANADLVPVDHGRTFADFRERITELGDIATEKGVRFDPTALRDRADFLQRRWDSAMGAVRDAFAEGAIDATKLQSVNGLLLVMDRAWVLPEAESDGRWHRNLYIGPDDDSGYAAWPLPTLRRAVEAEDEDAVEAAVAKYNKAFDQMAALLMALELAARMP
ncbi:MAG: M28 family peptidase [Phycisphaerales bacterium]